MRRNRSESFRAERQARLAYVQLLCIVLLTVAILVIMAITPRMSSAAEQYLATIAAEWAWNGTDPSHQGFRFYMDGEVVHEIDNPYLRSDVWDVPISNGVHQFELSAYGTKDGAPWESDKSPMYKFEYLHISKGDSRPAPRIYIRIN